MTTRKTWLAITAAGLLAFGCLCLLPIGIGWGYWLARQDVGGVLPAVAKAARSNNHRTIDEMVTEFKKRGLQVDFVEERGPISLGEWRRVCISKRDIYIARYDTSNSKQAEELKDIVARGGIDFPRADHGPPFMPLERNGSFLFGNHEHDHPNIRRIQEVFRSF